MDKDILLGCISLNFCTNSVILSGLASSVHNSRWIFMSASPLSRFSDIVDLEGVFKILSWLKLLSHSHEVTGTVCGKDLMLGNCIRLQSL